MRGSPLRRALGSLVVVSYLDAAGGEVMVSGHLDEVSDTVIAIVGGEANGQPVDGRLWVPLERVVTVQEPQWR